ncbi:acyltransferase family protein [Sphingomonas montana]|uniref:acyltransferase family protein n=1 Tax=Sphingomonas montana TaxID=1843236 RepID=UPI00096D096B|nr:acyltransferase family protein [Sphingomonas montana]
MSNLLHSKSVDTDVVLRAIAIALVAWNHAIPSGTKSLGLPDFAGGMTLLMMMSGYSFARFVLTDATPVEVRHGLMLFAKRILLPSLAAVLFFMLIKRKVSLTELLFVSNWFTTYRIAIFPVWYVQVILQMMVLLLGLFAIPPFARWFVAQPLRGSLVVFAAALATRMILPVFIDTKPLLHHLPHLYLWNFTLGWLVYFLHDRRTPGALTLASLAILASGAMVWGPLSYQFLALVVGGLLLVWKTRMKLPMIVARVVGLVSQATFTIFLLHRFFFVVYTGTVGRILPAGLLMWALGLAACTLAWVVGAATLRAYHKLAAAGMAAAVPGAGLSPARTAG